MQKIRKAVFPVAGFGTRFLPATKAMPKELLPIINKPLIQYAAEEAISAGIDTLIFITGRNKRAIEDHFDSNPELENALHMKGKIEQEEMVKNILPTGVECIFVRQSAQLGLGHAILCAERAVGNEPFAVLLADDFLTYSGKGVTANLVEAFNRSGKAQLSVMQVKELDISKYGIVKFHEKNVSGLIEKPDIQNAPSNFASIGRYVLNPEIFEILSNQKPGLNDEIQLSDAINIQAEAGSVELVPLSGNRFDCGSINGYIDAIHYVAKRDGFKIF
jgi:UTP--glucose-1-phosphate uridylyltransferase